MRSGLKHTIHLDTEREQVFIFKSLPIFCPFYVRTVLRM